MHGILEGGAWDQTRVEIPGGIPPLYVSVGTPAVVYRLEGSRPGVRVQDGELVAVYEAVQTK